MGLIEKVRGKTISVDTAPFIYFIKKNPDYIGLVKPIFSGIAKGLFNWGLTNKNQLNLPRLPNEMPAQ